MQAPKGPFAYAWHGSGRRWDALPLQAVGSAIGGILFLYLGVKLPQEILDNPSLSALLAIIIGGLAGAAAVFALRLCWWPVYKRLYPHGGLTAFLRKKLEAQMWPALMMFFGLMFFGAGAILFVIKAPASQANGSPRQCKGTNSAYNVSHKLEIVDKIYAELSGPVSDVQNRAGTLMNFFNAKLSDKTASQELEILVQEAKTVFERFDKIIFGYDYVREVYSIMIEGNNTYRNLEASTWNLKQGLQTIYNTMPPEQVPTVIQNSVYLSRWRSSVEDMARWITEKQNALRIKRREYESLDVCVS